jgi:ankyrin repeat protein
LRANASINILPPPVFRQLKSQLQLVSNDNDQEIPRRAEASYQYALAVLGQSQSKRADDEEIEEGLDMLCQAAVFGNQKAQCILSIVHEAFGRSAPFGADIEIPWLVEGTIQGSMTARRRLQLLDCHDYSEAMKTLRCKYGGIGLEVNIDNEELDDYVDMHYISHYSSPRMLQILAYAGRTDDVRGILLLNRYDIDEPDAWGETALLVACRSGHAEIAKLLLRAGANPRIPSMEMLTPLHFLSAFDDDDIPTIARLMNDNKVDIEARSINGRGFNIRVDCQFGKADGTPLLWAVAAGNLVATQTLVELGADPFDISGANVPVSSSWGDNFHLSPVDFAALKHQHIILEVMLNHSRRQSAEICEWHLNNNYRLLAPNPEFATLAMFWAIDYSSESILERLIIHGGTHQEACKKTIQVLIEHGASTAEIDNQGRSALEHASLQGQRFLIRFLLDHGGSEILASSSRLLLQMAHNTVRVHDYSSFDMLIHHAESIGTVFDDDDMEHFCARAAELGDNIFYIDFYLDDKRWNNVSNRNDGELFERAILKGHFGMARQIFEKGHVDLSKRLYPENGHSSATILGRLIARAKRYKNAVEKIEFFLSLVEASDEVFYNVITVFEMELTACHAACLHANFRPGLAASGPVIDAILKHFNQECYLNAQVSGGMCAGYTALHFAISDGNVPAAARLLETVINRNIVNDQGETPLDMVKMRWRNQRQFMAGVPLEERPIRKARHDQITEKLTHLLCRAGAVCRKYSMMVRKLEANTIRVEIFESDISDEATLNSNCKCLLLYNLIYL